MEYSCASMTFEFAHSSANMKQFGRPARRRRRRCRFRSETVDSSDVVFAHRIFAVDSQSHVSSDGSPPSAASTSLQSSLGSSNGTPISEEVAMASALYQAACPPPAGAQILEHGLYSSPSMPNISLGRPSANQPPAIFDGKMFSSMSEAQLRAMAAARFGLPLVSHHHVLQPMSGFCSQLPGELKATPAIAPRRAEPVIGATGRSDR